jgi:hypothetical protein
MAKRLEIIFYGMACFDRVRGGGFRVLFPDGREMGHIAGVWVRHRKKTATVRWEWISIGNDYFFTPSAFEISGTKKTKLDAGKLEGFLINLKQCDPDFKIAREPQVTGILRHVDRGTLSAHVINTDGQIVVKWMLDIADRAQVRINFGKNFIEPPPNVSQVVLANVRITGFSPSKLKDFVGSPVSWEPDGESDGFVPFDLGEQDDFQIYRKLSTEPDKPLVLKTPDKVAPSSGAVVIEPDDYIQWETPNIKCSPVASC